MRIDKCPECGRDNIEASAKVYVSNVVFEDGQIVSYDVDFVSEAEAVHDAIAGEGCGFSDHNVYCECGADLNHLWEESQKPDESEKHLATLLEAADKWAAEIVEYVIPDGQHDADEIKSLVEQVNAINAALKQLGGEAYAGYDHVHTVEEFE